jgi:hypothetical protein
MDQAVSLQDAKDRHLAGGSSSQVPERYQLPKIFLRDPLETEARLIEECKWRNSD